MANTFLKAEWRKLAMANYVIDKKILTPFLPAKTELDLWNNQCYVSLVGFMFLNTSIKGIRIPFHINFEEVNLRFYVRYKEGQEWKRGVVFIKEIVPKPALTFVANTVYGEHYETMKMAHTWIQDQDTLQITYKWKKNRWHSLSVTTSLTSSDINASSEEEFITEHYWGYTRINSITTSEYQVEHPRWKIYKTQSHIIDVDFGLLYGKTFEFLNHQKPVSVFLAEGSEIKVNGGRKI
ncbi:MAG TPA: DUF2071 domain-containing protein [Ohtaekwangia sp.]